MLLSQFASFVTADESRYIMLGLLILYTSGSYNHSTISGNFRIYLTREMCRKSVLKRLLLYHSATFRKLPESHGTIRTAFYG